MAKTNIGKGLVYVDGQWRQGNPRVLGPKSHAVWMSSVVFDGARAFQGVAPDLDRHCARAVRSAEFMGLAPAVAGPEIEELAWQGIRMFAEEAELYICPLFYAESGFILPDPDSTRFVLMVSESPLPPADGFAACLSSFRRPAPDMAPTEAKASCLYPNVARGLREAQGKGFDVAVVLDPDGDVAEFSYANLFMAKEGVLHTPAVNGTFLNGITRQRVIALMRQAGVAIRERTIGFGELLDADEIFGTGNYYKLSPCTRIEGRALPAGPLFRQARQLYFAFAKRR